MSWSSRRPAAPAPRRSSGSSAAARRTTSAAALAPFAATVTKALGAAAFVPVATQSWPIPTDSRAPRLAPEGRAFDLEDDTSGTVLRMGHDGGIKPVAEFEATEGYAINAQELYLPAGAASHGACVIIVRYDPGERFGDAMPYRWKGKAVVVP